MTDGNDTRTNTVNWRDWVLGRGDFSEENLKKARDDILKMAEQRADFAADLDAQVCTRGCICVYTWVQMCVCTRVCAVYTCVCICV